jgi:hypothetical protein
MATFRIRFLPNQGPGGDDEIQVTAATYTSHDIFVDFYDASVQNIAGTLNPLGNIVHRVRADLIADISKLE